MKRLVMFILVLFIIHPCVVKAEEESMQASFEEEKIIYEIKKFGIKAGEATLAFQGSADLDGRDVSLITFTAASLNFFDEEKIYIDPATFLPICVKRDLNIFGKKENITEYYETQKGRIRIIKSVQGKTSEQIIKKTGSVDNIYSFIYRHRKERNFALGNTYKINLPTQDVTMRLVKTDTMKAAGQTYAAYYMKSDPKKYKIWFDTGPAKIPLRIDGVVGFGNTSMVLKAYLPQWQGQAKKAAAIARHNESK